MPGKYFTINHGNYVSPIIAALEPPVGAAKQSFTPKTLTLMKTKRQPLITPVIHNPMGYA